MATVFIASLITASITPWRPAVTPEILHAALIDNVFHSLRISTKTTGYSLLYIDNSEYNLINLTAKVPCIAFLGMYLQKVFYTELNYYTVQIQMHYKIELFYLNIIYLGASNNLAHD